MILNTPIETMILTDKKKLQGQKLEKLLQRIYEKTNFYQERMDALGLAPADIKGIEDLHKLPFTTVADLSSQYPFGLLTMPISGVARFEQQPDSRVANGFTTQDLVYQQEMLARSLVACYIITTSVLLYLPEAVPSIGSRSLLQSAEMLGVTVITEQTKDFKAQLQTILNFGVTTLFSTPNVLLLFANFVQEQGLTSKDLPVMNLLCEEHLLSPALHNELSSKFQVPIYTLYGHENIMSLGIAGECYLQQGLHIHDDHFYPEIIDPETGLLVTTDQPGELVITTLSREATPLLRYRTGTIARLVYETCACGRTSPRLILDKD